MDAEQELVEVRALYTPYTVYTSVPACFNAMSLLLWCRLWLVSKCACVGWYVEQAEGEMMETTSRNRSRSRAAGSSGAGSKSRSRRKKGGGKKKKGGKKGRKKKKH